MSSVATAEGPSMVPAGPNGATRSMWSYFAESITTKFATFSGRAGRKEYWAFQLFGFLILIALAVLCAVAVPDIDPASDQGPGFAAMAPLILLGLVVVASIIPSIAVLVRRLHDLGMSGWWALMALIPAIWAVGFIIIGVIPGQPVANKFGPSTY